jgi:hypothetical protein
MGEKEVIFIWIYMNINEKWENRGDGWIFLVFGSSDFSVLHVCRAELLLCPGGVNSW